MRANRKSRPDYYVEIPEAVRKAYGINDPEPEPQEESTESTGLLPSIAAGLIAVVLYLTLLCGVQTALSAAGQIKTDLDAISLMNANHGMTMEEFCENTRYEPYEYWAVFDGNGRKVGECTIHDTGRVEIPEELYRYAERRGATTDAHCHPGVDCPFSVADLWHFLIFGKNYGVTKTCVVSPHYLYELEMSPDTEIDYGEYSDFLSVFLKYNKDDPTYFTRRVHEDGTIGYASNDAFIEVVAERYGFTFTKTPLD